MRSSSVATITLSSTAALQACCQVRMIMGMPLILASGLPGNLEELYLAGMTPICNGYQPL